MDEDTLKQTLMHVIQEDENFKNTFPNVIKHFGECKLVMDYSGKFTGDVWNTYQAYLHIKVPYKYRSSFEDSKDALLALAKKIYGQQNGYLLCDIIFEILPISPETIEPFDFSTSNIISEKVIADAKLFISEGRFDSAFDRIHTFFHGYLKSYFQNKGETITEADSLPKLFGRFIDSIPPIKEKELVKSILRSFSGTVNIINKYRNSKSLAHPNTEIISEREAKFVVSVSANIIRYINDILKD